ncbi:hypothetical protein [uncultured Maribacter sp.]|uniref:hypothetical protein n=1 Tax=uncultured Maribacter sp. TaxID=431308 RepID=UPI0026183517|nr:hypothetical protein [uncultured Maribacter sp.]
MKNKLNILLSLSFLISVILAIWVYYQTTHRIGDIAYNQNTDNSEFIVCNEDSVLQYYAVGTHYQGGEKMIKKN